MNSAKNSGSMPKFEPRMDLLAVAEIMEITRLTIPEDYVSKRKTIRRYWKITV